MTQPLWFFGTRLTIVADHTTTGGQYHLKATSPLAHSLLPIATRAIGNNSMCCPGSSRSGQVRTRLC